jgi:hypothetical protein
MFPTPSASCQMDVVAPPETVQSEFKRVECNQSSELERSLEQN